MMKLTQHLNTTAYFCVWIGQFSRKKHVKRIYLEQSKTKKDVVIIMSEAWVPDRNWTFTPSGRSMLTLVSIYNNTLHASRTSTRSVISHCQIPTLPAGCSLENTLVSIIPVIGSAYGFFNFSALVFTFALGPSVVIGNTLCIMFAGSLLARVCESEDKYYIHYIFQTNVK